jgi:hypothetical protein
VFEDLFVGEGGGPTVGVEDGRIQPRVNIIQLFDFGAGDGVAGFFVEGGAVERLAATRSKNKPLFADLEFL